MCNKETKYWQRERVFKKRNDLSSIPCFSFLVFVHIAHAKQQASQADRQTGRQEASKHQIIIKNCKKNPRKSSSKQAGKQGGKVGGRHQTSSKVGWAAGKHLKWNLLQVDQKASIVNKEIDWSDYYLISYGTCKL